jgi:hypothetical protein
MKVIDYISELRRDLPADFPNISDRMLLRLIDEFRAVGIKNSYNENKEIDRRIVQTLSGIELKVTDISDVPFISTTSRILKTVVPIPAPVKLSHRDLVIAVRNAKILSEPYNYISKDAAIYAGNGRYNRNDVFTFLYDNYLYVKLNPNNPKLRLLTHISIELVCETPTECIPFQYNDYFDYREYEYPLTDVLWGYIKASILENGLRIIQSDIQGG